MPSAERLRVSDPRVVLCWMAVPLMGIMVVRAGYHWDSTSPFPPPDWGTGVTWVVAGIAAVSAVALVFYWSTQVFTRLKHWNRNAADTTCWTVVMIVLWLIALPLHSQSAQSLGAFRLLVQIGTLLWVVETAWEMVLPWLIRKKENHG